jgi:hypothetical protein
MLNEQTLSTLNSLRLFGMARGFSERLAHPEAADLSHEEFLGLLVHDENTYRENLRLKRLLHNAKLKQNAALADVDYKHPRGLNKQRNPRTLFCPVAAQPSNPQRGTRPLGRENS